MVYRYKNWLRSSGKTKKMGERKVLNRYIPPDFDPSIIPKFKRQGDRLMEVRMMLPFSLRCNTCGEFMYKGKKFNSKSEIIRGEDYMGIKKFRFYIKCVMCNSEIAFKTDPKNADYECESGASRNFELWRDSAEAIEKDKKEREEEDKVDSMKALENRTLDSRIEMEVMDALDEIKAINQRHERIDTDKLLVSLQSSSKVEDTKAIDDEIIKNVKFKNKGNNDDNTIISSSSSLVSKLQNQIKSNETKGSDVFGTTIIKKKRKVEEEKTTSNKKNNDTSSNQITANINVVAEVATGTIANSNALGSFCNYDSD